MGEGASAFTASAIASKGEIYVAGEDGEIYAILAGLTFQLLGRNLLEEACLATRAISEEHLILCTRGHQVEISQNQ